MEAFVFPGQGSQRRGMGVGLFDLREFHSNEEAIDRLLGYSLKQACLEDPGNKLRETQYTQPCLYVVNALHYYKACSEGRRPDYVAGHSLGEYDALLAAGAFDFMTGLRLVAKRGALMAQAKGGAMAAVIGLTTERVSAVLLEHQIDANIANHNAPTQTVISGSADHIVRAEQLFREAGAQLYLPLPVSGAFHSGRMTGVATAFSDFIGSFVFDKLQVPVISNVSGEPYPEGNPTETIRSLLVRQIMAPVQWMQSIHFLLSKGVRQFSEMGPGSVLSRLSQQIQIS